MAGFVYIMSNPAFADGRIKIGKSDRDPEEFRKSELNSTGVPEPFKVEYSAYVQNHHELEKKIHRHFHAQRPNKNREFFTCSIMDAISAIRDLAGKALKFEDNYFEDYEALKKKLEEEKLRIEEEEKLRIESEEEERLEKLRIEREEDERLEKLRIEREEDERLEKLRIEREEDERLEKLRIEREEDERLEKLRIEREEEERLRAERLLKEERERKEAQERKRKEEEQLKKLQIERMELKRKNKKEIQRWRKLFAAKERMFVKPYNKRRKKAWSSVGRCIRDQIGREFELLEQQIRRDKRRAAYARRLLAELPSIRSRLEPLKPRITTIIDDAGVMKSVRDRLNLIYPYQPITEEEFELRFTSFCEILNEYLIDPETEIIEFKENFRKTLDGEIKRITSTLDNIIRTADNIAANNRRIAREDNFKGGGSIWNSDQGEAQWRPTEVEEAKLRRRKRRMRKD
jgi:hypothetical protein